MATFEQGYLGGFSGKLGPAVGYNWRGRWCLRSKPGVVRNPRTERQQAHRMMFKEEVLLASRLRWVLRETLDGLSLAEHLTPANLFIRENQAAFGWRDGRLEVEWSRLRLAMGPVAPVAFDAPQVSGGTTLTVTFEKNPLHMRADAMDCVWLYVYCPEQETGYLAAPVFRRQRRISVTLPDAMAGCTIHLWGMVEDEHGRWSDSIYIGSGPLEDTGADVAATATESGATEAATMEITEDSAVAAAQRHSATPTAPPSRADDHG